MAKREASGNVEISWREIANRYIFYFNLLGAECAGKYAIVRDYELIRFTVVFCLGVTEPKFFQFFCKTFDMQRVIMVQ